MNDDVMKAIIVTILMVALIGSTYAIEGVSSAINHQTEALMSDACGGE